MAEYIPIILITFFGFCALAYLLLAPVYRFLKREEKAGDEWTRAVHSEQLHHGSSAANGAPVPDPDAEREAPRP